MLSCFFDGKFEREFLIAVKYVGVFYDVITGQKRMINLLFLKWEDG